MKRLSLQWRMTLLTALLIACACICLNLLLYRSGATGMDSLGGYIMQYQPGDVEGLAIEIPDDQISDFLIHFSQEVCDAKALYGYKGWIITSVVTLLSAAIAYFVTGSALKPLGQFSRQAEKINQDSIATLRLDESTVREFQQLSRSVNQMLDRLAQSFDLQRQFAGNAAHELRTPLAILQTKLELFAEEHPDMDAETAELVGALLEQLGRLTSLVRTLLEMSNLLSVSRSDHIALAPLADEILADLTPLTQQNGVSLRAKCDDVCIIGSDALIYRLLFNLVENGIKYNRPGGSVTVSIRQEEAMAVLHVSDTGMGIPPEYRDSVFQPFSGLINPEAARWAVWGWGLRSCVKLPFCTAAPWQWNPAPTAERPLGSPCRRSRMVDFISIFHILTCGNDKSHRIDRWLQLVDISKLGLNSKIKKFSYSFICGKGYSPPRGGE